ncbi:AFR740Wp [Eremothecium gossypii ATCC 10895]|uniref:AFR740Wp n=1 Tax=Eremothecium gossypii (strain ATCC 10895 / CBS 109.51 / FGSC 9923 / NRRL Y-1056) TaxID=284811 RepID=Q751T5_EREGS|nr:AFR740Wp [Eremothecium gossypii ATCC 10895]AAS54112.1 AFR740Wp [Eremothecium gossypii ATCC 10895]AEY98428.1 FAFR740Wp [Eremothecium gossypii FDAG1]
MGLQTLRASHKPPNKPGHHFRSTQKISFAKLGLLARDRPALLAHKRSFRTVMMISGLCTNAKEHRLRFSVPDLRAMLVTCGPGIRLDGDQRTQCAHRAPLPAAHGVAKWAPARPLSSRIAYMRCSNASNCPPGSGRISSAFHLHWRFCGLSSVGRVEEGRVSFFLRKLLG